jgi:hypothetical protein
MNLHLPERQKINIKKIILLVAFSDYPAYWFANSKFKKNENEKTNLFVGNCCRSNAGGHFLLER